MRKAYTAAYDRRLRHPAWVSAPFLSVDTSAPYPGFQTAEHLTLASLGKSGVAPASDGGAGDRTRSTFTEDDSLPTPFRAKLQDYFKSGYDRGHMYVFPLGASWTG